MKYVLFLKNLQKKIKRFCDCTIDNIKCEFNTKKNLANKKKKKWTSSISNICNSDQDFDETHRPYQKTVLRQFSDGQFPEGEFSERTFPRRIVPRVTYSRKDISPNHIFLFIWIFIYRWYIKVTEANECQQNWIAGLLNCLNPIEIPSWKLSVNFKAPLRNLIRSSFLEVLKTVEGKPVTPVKR